MSAAELPLWTAEERESFFAAIARHRRAAWQVSAVAAVCIVILAFVVATLTSPLFYAVIGLLLDVINLVVPMPDLLGGVMETLSNVSDHIETQPASSWLHLALVAALPGLIAVLLVLLTLRRIVREGSVLLEPLLALIWRRRKYLADAIAVQLTRDPQALSDALGELGNGGGFPAWCSHMLIAGGARRGGLLSGSSVPMYPPNDKRLEALARMGATVTLSPPRGMPLWVKALVAVAGVVVVSLLSVAIYLFVMISIALSGLFTLLPTVILHAILR